MRNGKANGESSSAPSDKSLPKVDYRRTPAKRLPKMPPRFRVRTLGKRSRDLSDLCKDIVSIRKCQTFEKDPWVWRVHFTPTSASWINQVERFFANLTEKQIRRGVHRSTRQLEQAIRADIDIVNRQPSRSNGPSRPTTSWLQWISCSMC
jgi:hypothetical protein